MNDDTNSDRTTSNDLSGVAAQLVEAARKARDGDREAARAHIAHAVALLHGKPGFGSSVSPDIPAAERKAARGGLAAWQARRVIAHIEANLDRRIQVRELAGLLGLSASHFCRAFKCSFGASPRSYVLHRRIEVAQGLLLTTSEPLSSIALSCGMCDHPHFSRTFYRIVGETPYSWRRRWQEQICTSPRGQTTSPVAAGALCSEHGSRRADDRVNLR